MQYIFSENPLVDDRVKELSKHRVESLARALEDPKKVQYLEIDGPLMQNIQPITIGTELSKLSNMEVLDVLHYQSVTFPNNLHTLSKLHTLILLGNEFSNERQLLGDQVQYLPALYSLYVSIFYPLVVQESFAKMGKLKRLFIDDCKLEGLSHICRIKSIEELSLNCEVAESYDCLQNLINLKRLRLLTDSVPAVIHKLQLSTLCIAASKLAKLPNWLGHMSTIEELDISYSNVATLPDGFKNLKVLDIRMTPLAKDLSQVKARFPDAKIYV